jgi:hypothetical protein
LAIWQINREERGGKESVEMGEQVAGQSQYRIGLGVNKTGLPSEH